MKYLCGGFCIKNNVLGNRLIQILGSLLIFFGAVCLLLIFSPVLIQEVDYQVKNINPEGNWIKSPSFLL